MKYLNGPLIKDIGIDWPKTIDVIDSSIKLLKKKEYSQPVKPYLRYKDLKNRIIAMPAYIGGEYSTAGIKWIASFPDNIKHNLKRAHATVILNDHTTGKPYAIINTSLISSIRTASVTGYILRKYISAYGPHKEKFDVGIIGLGPIGLIHLDMICKLNYNNINKIFVYDIKGIDMSDIPDIYKHKIEILNKWEDVYNKVSILVTCTVAENRYINLPARKGTLHLNISLRDYCAEFIKQTDLIIVDNWEEVCRENTDIHFMHLNHNLQQKDVLEIDDDLLDNKFTDLNDKTVMFNPMGMAIFDMAISNYYYKLSNKLNIGIILPDDND